MSSDTQNRPLCRAEPSVPTVGDRPVTQFARDLQEITVRRDLTALFTNEFEQQGCGK